MAKKTYYEKLKDPRWQKKRLEVMEHNNFSCELCGDGESTLNIHHKEYFRDHEPWDYTVEQLACLCESCHAGQHETFDLLKWVCSYARLDGPENRTELAMLVAGYTGIPYDGILSVSGLYSHEHHKMVYEQGAKANTAVKGKPVKKVKRNG